jgi:rhodanese-related sulfurtransferase
MHAMATIEREELRARLEGAEPLQLVFVHGEWAYHLCHIPSSRIFTSLAAALAALRPDDEIVLYCTGDPCASSAVAYRLLTERGYGRVRRYPGGLADWYAAGYPLEGEEGCL